MNDSLGVPRPHPLSLFSQPPAVVRILYWKVSTQPQPIFHQQAGRNSTSNWIMHSPATFTVCKRQACRNRKVRNPKINGTSIWHTGVAVCYTTNVVV